MNSPRGSDHGSWVAPVTRTGRGATSAISSFESTGMSFQWPPNLWKPAAIQCEPAMLSVVSPKLRRRGFAPPSPEQLT